jgi:FAD/FMN-containing dehydrogenase
MIRVATPHDAVSLLADLRRRLADHIQAFELIPGRAVRFVLRHVPGTRFPFSSDQGWYVLLEVSEADLLPPLEEALLPELESGRILDAAVAKNRAEAEAFWRLRHSISEAQKREGASLKHDVSVPVGEVARFIASAEDAVSRALPGLRVVAFGHVGDGNIHFNLSQPEGWSADDFYAERERLATVVYDVVTRFAGSISAEHGIGKAKRDYLRKYKSATDIRLMQAVKQALDPENLLNPGKVI